MVVPKRDGKKVGSNVHLLTRPYGELALCKEITMKTYIINLTRESLLPRTLTIDQCYEDDIGQTNVESAAHGVQLVKHSKDCKSPNRSSSFVA